MLQVNNLYAGYGNSNVLKGINLTVERNQLVAVVGPNGAGKTTLMSALTGLLEFQGEVVLEGQQLKSKDFKNILLAGISHVPEGRQLFPHLSVLDNLELGLYAFSCSRKMKRDAIESVFSLFPILETRAKQMAGTLSGGEQQMVAIGRAIVSKPKILVMDEPSLGLAPIVVDKILEALVKFKESGMTMLLVEQDIEIAFELSDYMYVLQTGSVMAEGKSVILKNDPNVKSIYLPEKRQMTNQVVNG